jgi:hypothetical protein
MEEVLLCMMLGDSQWDDKDLCKDSKTTTMDDYVVGNEGDDGSNDDEDIMGAYDDLMATPV